MKTSFLTPWPSWRRIGRRASMIAHVHWSVLCVTLALAVLAARLTGPGGLARKLFSAADWSDGPPVLDSFSEPAVACAILQQETDRCWWAAQTGRAVEQQVSPGQPGAQVATAGTQPLGALAAQIREVDFDLKQRLLEIALDDHSWDAFADLYLSMAYEAPDRPEIWAWARSALDCAEKCGRVEEVESTVRRVIRLRQALGSAEALEAVLQHWETRQCPGQRTEEQR